MKTDKIRKSGDGLYHEMKRDDRDSLMHAGILTLVWLSIGIIAEVYMRFLM